MRSEHLAAHLLGLRGATTCSELLDDLLQAAIRYARVRVNWAMLERSARPDIEAARTASHEVLIDVCNILSRAMHRAGENNKWRASLGTDRQFIGDVACHIHCLLGIEAG